MTKKIISKTALLKKDPLFINNFGDSDDVFSEYRADGLSRYQWEFPQEEVDGKLLELNKRYKILFADYTYESYSGDSYVLGYDKESKLFFEVTGSHCSCYGLEGQWDIVEYESWEILSEVILKTFGAKVECSWYSRDARSSNELKTFLEIK